MIAENAKTTTLILPTIPFLDTFHIGKLRQNKSIHEQMKLFFMKLYLCDEIESGLS